ncbi:Hpt domain-containing protein [Actinoplanes oblitus]|uniref:Hpt domain-containing protein n=1 Tax=Actinoplanes oblitus TaxID=3040509 RepID=A0ABY8WP93_9ACTN|nr:Hpt domain-containing protein [Actinoplanes oblitus]WIM98836.1 Hpt domain-containing protein [Actinoplanes oblitus]
MFEERLAAVRDRIETITDPDPTPAERALVLRLLRNFAARTPDAVDQVTASLENAADLGVLRDQAHALKGSAGNIGAAALATLCATVEDQARAGKLTDPVSMAGRIRAEAAGALRAVTALAEEYEAAASRQ